MLLVTLFFLTPLFPSLIISKSLIVPATQCINSYIETLPPSPHILWTAPIRFVVKKTKLTNYATVSFHKLLDCWTADLEHAHYCTSWALNHSHSFSFSLNYYIYICVFIVFVLWDPGETKSHSVALLLLVQLNDNKALIDWLIDWLINDCEWY